MNIKLLEIKFTPKGKDEIVAYEIAELIYAKKFQEIVCKV